MQQVLRRGKKKLIILSLQHQLEIIGIFLEQQRAAGDREAPRPVVAFAAASNASERANNRGNSERR
jgi:hypothetical protein